MFSVVKLFSIAATLLVTVTGVLTASSIIPTNPLGDVAAIQLPNGDTRLYFQNDNGDIIQYVVSNSFDVGQFLAMSLVVPANEVKWDTSIAVATLPPNFSEIHIYFYSPSNVLSEYWLEGPTTWHGGFNCTDCMTRNGFTSADNGDVLYAMQNPDTKQLRVGFVSSGSPTGLTEAISVSNGGAWHLAVLN